MKRLSIAVMAVLAGASVLAASAADAQSWDYHSDLAGRAYHGAEVHDIQSRRDQHAADVAAYYGDYAAADAYAHAAAVRRAQSRRDFGFARHEAHDARRDYWRGGWGY